jgi:hypothetical protein
LAVVEASPQGQLDEQVDAAMNWMRLLSPSATYMLPAVSNDTEVGPLKRADVAAPPSPECPRDPEELPAMV